MKGKVTPVMETPLSDEEIQSLIKKHKIPISDVDVKKFGDSLRHDFEIYKRDKARLTVNGRHAEIASLLEAAEKGKVEALATLLRDLSPESHASLEDRAARIGISLPSHDELKHGANCKAACDAVAQLCRTGGEYIEGRKRPAGKQSKTWRPRLYAPKKQPHTPKRDAERSFVINLQLTWLEAAGKMPALTANPVRNRPGPFARFVKNCLERANSGHVDAVEVINSLWRAGKPGRERHALLDAKIEIEPPMKLNLPVRQ